MKKQGKIKGSSERPRLCVFRSNKHIYAQIIDDIQGRTIVAASTLNRAIRTEILSTSTCAASRKVGEHIGENAFNLGIKQVVFDRRRKKYHGRIKSLAEGARKAGLQF